MKFNIKYFSAAVLASTPILIYPFIYGFIPTFDQHNWKEFATYFSSFYGPFLTLATLIYIWNKGSQDSKDHHQQITFSNYFKHKEEFFYLLEQLEIEFKIEFFEKGSFYKKLFPQNTSQYVEFQSKEVDSKESYLEFQCWELRQIIDNFFTQKQNAINTLEGIVRTSEELHFKVLDGYPFKWPSKVMCKTDKYNLAFEVDRPLLHSEIIVKVLEQLYDFCLIQSKLRCGHPHPPADLVENLMDCVVGKVMDPSGSYMLSSRDFTNK